MIQAETAGLALCEDTKICLPVSPKLTNEHSISLLFHPYKKQSVTITCCVLTVFLDCLLTVSTDFLESLLDAWPLQSEQLHFLHLDKTKHLPLFPAS